MATAAAPEGGGGAALAFSVASVVEDVLQQHGNRSRDLDLDARRAEEAAIRRYEAAAWLRKIIGVVGAKDLPAEPSEDEFRLGLRSGIILCNVLNKLQPGAVPKVVESPCDAALIPDGAALSAYQYFENVRNFLVAVQELGIPSFEASDLEQGGKSSRVVNCVLALKSYAEWKQAGSIGVWRFGGNVKQVTSAKQFGRKNPEPFTSSLSRTASLNEKSVNCASTENESNKERNSSLSMLVRAVLLDKKPEEVPNLVESVLNKVVEEFEQRIASQIQLKATLKDSTICHANKPFLNNASGNVKVGNKNATLVKKDNCFQKSYNPDKQLKVCMKQQMIVDQQERDIKELKQTLSTTKAGMQFMQSKFHEEIQNLGLHIHGLAHAASGYHRVLEENRRLYNQVQDLKGSIRVYCRVRPFLPRQNNHISTVDHIEEGTITINTPAKHGKGRRSFNFNKVFGPSATQEEVFSDTQPLIRSVLDGYNVCIFAYGQTGSGKTYTMSGPKDLTEENQGVNYRALGDLFLLAEQRRDTFYYDVSVQMIEIYNEQVRDLLVTDGINKRYPLYNIRVLTGLNVPEASLVHVTSTYDVIDLMNLGQRNRAVGATALNDRSSRSHSCLTVHVQGRDLTAGNILRGCMHLVDLAGSERVDKSEVTGDRLKEAQHINKSLSALGDVISSLAQKNVHIPYRNSKLTQLLQDSLGGQAKTLMFVHISPEPDAIGETISTLKFAERVATVELGAARVNRDSADVKDLKEQIASLKAALAQKEGDTEMKQLKISSSPYAMRPQERDMSTNYNSQRKPMGDVGNIEVCSNSALRQKKQSFDLDELLGNSPPWPPVTDSRVDHMEDDKEMGSGEWVDKVMVNKQDPIKGADSPLECWEENGTNDFYQKYLSNSSGLYSDKAYKLLQGNGRLEVAATDDLDELDAATSDSSEPDLLWQLNHSRLNSFTSESGTRIQKQNPRQANNSNLRSLVPKLGPSPSRKMSNGLSHPPLQNGRQAGAREVKRKNGTRK
ncbi:unnamed protein product [Coffea canephora]|uniref:Kinesin motor domain-containing protein n=1 Tax=Coffea canephora TaxID=49390 RepID=A0A068V961_COFCA|nr:unnamed protein product [Coffea canephora]